MSKMPARVLPAALSGLALLVSTSAVSAGELAVSFTDSKWDGKKVPEDQVCQRFDGNGATPPMKVSGLPAGTDAVVVSFNDKTYDPMDRGGHGVISFAVPDGVTEVMLPAVAGESDDLPAGVTMVKAHQGQGWSGTGGAYLPPCSGWRGNTYTADVRAMKGGDVVAEGMIKLGDF